MHHRLLEKKISPVIAVVAVAAVGSLLTLLIVRTITTAEFIASQTYEEQTL